MCKWPDPSVIQAAFCAVHYVGDSSLAATRGTRAERKNFEAIIYDERPPPRSSLFGSQPGQALIKTLGRSYSDLVFSSSHIHY